jgi:hypothetical protein
VFGDRLVPCDFGAALTLAFAFTDVFAGADLGDDARGGLCFTDVTFLLVVAAVFLEERLIFEVTMLNLPEVYCQNYSAKKFVF